MINKLSARIVQFIREHHEHAASEEVLTFSISTLLNSLFTFVVILILSSLTGHATEAIVLMGSFIALRYVSGGVHLRSSFGCNLFSICVMLGLIHWPVSFWHEGFILNCIAMILVAWLAPKDIMHLNLAGPKYRHHFKAIGMVLVGLNFFIASPVVALAFIAQAISLTPIAYKAADFFEKR
jgi:accessory gene regulator B